MNVAFIGLGIMGSRMAVNLAKSEHELVVWNRSPVDHSIWKERKVNLASSVREAVVNADVVFTMLSTPEAVRQIGTGKDGVLDTINQGKIWIDCSTVDPRTTREMAKEAYKHHVHFIDAPVAGSAPQAEAAELVFFLGGDKLAIDRVAPLLEFMGKKQMNLGDHGMGSSFKLLVNAMLGQSMVIFSETVAFGEAMGLQRDFLLDVLPNLVVTAPFVQMKAPSIKVNDYGVQFPLEWMHKDLVLATNTARDLGQSMKLANLTKELFEDAKESGLARKDFSAIHQFIEKGQPQ